MKIPRKILIITLGALALTGLASTKAQLVITEVDPAGSSDANYGQDWFELTNYGSSAIDLTGYKIDDNSDSFSVAVALNSPVTSIAPNQSIVYIETTGATASTIVSNFDKTWFGSSVPSTFQIGTYSGSGVGLSQNGDAVNIFNASGTQVTGVDFGADPTPSVTLDNSILRVTNDGIIATPSVLGVDGAFVATDGEVGSPGTVGLAVPEPSSIALILAGLGLLFGFARFRSTRLMS